MIASAAAVDWLVGTSLWGWPVTRCTVLWLFLWALISALSSRAILEIVTLEYAVETFASLKKQARGAELVTHARTPG